MNKVAPPNPPSEQPPEQPPEQPQLLAGYILGNLDPAEARLLEQLLKDNSALETELAQLQQSLDDVYGEEVAPPAHLKSRILSAITPSVTQPTATVVNRLPATESALERNLLDQPPQSPSPASLAGGSFSRWTLPRWAVGGLGLAAAGAIAALGMQNYTLNRTLQALQPVPETQRPEKPLTFTLKPTEGVQAGEIEVVIDPVQKSALLKAQNLPPLPADQVYALWTVVAADTPVTKDDQNAILTAVFEVDEMGNQVKQITIPEVFYTSDTSSGTSSGKNPAIKAVAVTVEAAAAPQKHQSSPMWIQRL